MTNKMIPIKDNLRFSFPSIPDSLKSKYGVDELELRPFGPGERDIEIDFEQEFRPCLVTQVLQCCTETLKGERPDQEFFRQLTIDKRIEALLAIVTRGGSEELTLQLHCLQETCGEIMEIELSQEDIIGRQPPCENIGTFRIPVNDRDYFFRKPTGSDQLEWLKSSFPDEETAVRAMIRTLTARQEASGTGRERMSPKWIEAVNEAMKAYDPLVNFNLTVFCPECNQESRCVLDLEEILVRKLFKIQQELLHIVHRLASHYHWTEQQILLLGPRRQACYLALIAKEGAK
jgi:hypothetical protein